MVVGSTSETEIIESHRFSFWCMGRWLAALQRPSAHHRNADTWPTANARTKWALWRKAAVSQKADVYPPIVNSSISTKIAVE
jgi:hypothetical protein